MLVIARLYDDEGRARAAVNALVELGYSSDDIALMEGPKAPIQHEGDVTETANPTDMVNKAVRIGSMLGQHADFYMQRLTEGRALVAVTPPFIASRMVEVTLDEYKPLSDSHVPAPEPFVPLSEQATPLSNMLGLPVLVNGTMSEAFGFDTQQDGLSHFSQWFKPLAPDFTFSSLVGWKIKSSNDTPLSSMLGLPVKSERLEGKASSFGISLKSKSGTPFSSMLGLPLLSKREHYLS
ncbi:hypothetical protein R0135_13345 [Congregibacter variabilis]|uniref:Uncharacterized protein n=1 Tax=Congregibacter variabilis TaxID=3081200 RepID=A0ABZ0I2B5_9GAMM|nr:hypothetical protein R0135_13345 [Congregibacter sp. IMCC43200]